MAVASLLNSTKPRHWRQQQELLIAVEVLYDLTTLPPDPHDRRTIRDSYCVFLGQDRSGHFDPPESVLNALRTRLPKVHPASDCDEWGVRTTGAPAALIGVSSFEWKTDEFVRVEGERTIGPLAGGGWIYTLSLTPQGWKVDTVRDNWIS